MLIQVNEKLKKQLKKEIKEAMKYYRSYDFWGDFEIDVSKVTDEELHNKVMGMDTMSDYESAMFDAGYVEGLRFALKLINQLRK